MNSKVYQNHKRNLQKLSNKRKIPASYKSNFKTFSKIPNISKNQNIKQKYTTKTKSNKIDFSNETWMDRSSKTVNSYLPTVENEKVSLANSDILVKKSNFKPTKQSENKMQNSLKHNPNSELRIFHLNPRSIVDKLENLLEFVQSNKPDLLFLTETWMDSSVPQNSHLLDGYKIIRYDRPEKFKIKYNKPGNGGGIAILYKENLIVEKYNGIREDTEEIFWVLVKGSKGLLVGTVYNTEYCELIKSKKENESIFEQHLREVSATACDVCVLGDFNIDLLEKTKPKTKKLKTLFKTYGFTNKITTHTRTSTHTGRKSLLDHIWLNNPEKCLASGTVNGLGDHLGTFVTLNKKPKKAKVKKIKIRNFKKYEPENFNKELKEKLDLINISELLTKNMVNEATEKFTFILRDTLDKHAPMIEIIPGQKKKYVPWYNEELKKKLKYRKDLLADSLNHGKNLYKDRLKKMTKEINLVKKLLKIDWIKKEIQDYNGDIKKLWKLIHFIIGNQNTKDITEPEDINQETADNHNNYFATIGLEIQKLLNIDMEQPTSDNFDYPSFKFENETISNIKSLIDGIKKDVATGIDCIPAKILKDTKHIISPFLCDIINKCYETKIFPDILKIASIKPIYKSGDKNDISNYRPISILPVLSKIFERSAAIQLVQYFEKK